MANKDEAPKTKEERANGREYRKYATELRLAEREFETYISRADKIVRRYRDEDRKDKNSDADMPARFNILWSNTETLAPALYAKTPKVQVDRRFRDADPLGRLACNIWERCTQFAIDNYDFDSVMKSVVKDYQLAGRGTAWVRYEPSVSDDGLDYQEVSCDHVHYSDFGHTPAKQWRNVRLVWRKIYLNRKQLVDRFGRKIGKEITLDYSPLEKTNDNRKADDSKDLKQACIYEMWDADSMNTIWLSKSYTEGVLDIVQDPLGLHDFFPTPKPLYANLTTETLIPIPDYAQYQDQARELDQITLKIALLEDALRLVGFYDGTYASDLSALYSNPRTNEMIPISNWQKLQAAGGIKGIAEWMELGEIIEALTALHQTRDKVKQDLYELTGIADIIRGASAQTGTPVTATERRIQGQFATLRIQERQRDVERYARDLVALQGEVIAEHFEPQLMAEMSGMSLNDPAVAQQVMQAIELLKNDPIRSFRLSLETDSMISVDDTFEKQKTTEFLQTFGRLLQGSMQAVMQAPVLAPMLGETLLFGVRRFRAGRSLETTIEQGMQGLTQMAQQAMTQQKPDPKMAEVQGRLQLEQTKSQNDLALKQNESMQKLALERDEMQQRLQLEKERFNQEMALEREKFVQEIALEREKAMADIAVEREKARAGAEAKQGEMDQMERLETKKLILQSKPKDLHVLKDGSFTTKPIIKKTVRFTTDPVTKERVGHVIEQAVGDVDADEAAPVLKTAKVSTDPLTGERRVSGVEVPITNDL